MDCNFMINELLREINTYKNCSKDDASLIRFLRLTNDAYCECDRFYYARSYHPFPEVKYLIKNCMGQNDYNNLMSSITDDSKIDKNLQFQLLNKAHSCMDHYNFENICVDHLSWKNWIMYKSKKCFKKNLPYYYD